MLFRSMRGEMFSGMQGAGSDFKSIRDYQYGDTFRHVNRFATARTGEIHLNEYLEERLLSLHVLIDQSSSLFFTSTLQMKSVVAAKVGVSLLFHYLNKGHRVGAEVFNGNDFSYLPATRSYSTCEEWLYKLAEYSHHLTLQSTKEQNYSLKEVLNRCIEQNICNTELYILSDAMIYGKQLEEALATLSRRNKVTFINIADKLEENPPTKVWLTNGNQYYKINNNKELKNYQSIWLDKKQYFTDFATTYGIEYKEIYT